MRLSLFLLSLFLSFHVLAQSNIIKVEAEKHYPNGTKTTYVSLGFEVEKSYFHIIEEKMRSVLGIKHFSFIERNKAAFTTLSELNHQFIANEIISIYSKVKGADIPIRKFPNTSGIARQIPGCDSQDPFLPFCTEEVYDFPAAVNQPSLGYIGCLNSTPNPAWYFMQIEQPGNLVIQISSGYDVDFIAWGPFESIDDACQNIQLVNCFVCPNNTTNPNFYPYGLIVDCSYSGSATETLTINNAQAGEIYVVLITNFSNQPTNIIFSQTNSNHSGAGGADCSIIAPPVFNNGPLCVGETLILTINEPVENAVYNWSGPNGFSSSDMSPIIPNVSLENAGIYSLTVTVDEVTSDPETTTVIINSLPNVVFNTLDPICFNSPAAELNNGQPAGGEFSGTGIDSNGWFDPSISGIGTFDLIYSFTDENGCSNTAAGEITVIASPSAALGFFDSVCENSHAFQLTGGTPSGGTYSGIGVVDSWFNPTESGAGIFDIFYTFTAENGCSDVATTTITVLNLPIVTIEIVQSVCDNSSAFELTGGNPVGGVYSGQGDDGNGWFDPTESGTGAIEISYAFTDQNGCSNTATTFITVFATPQVSLDTLSPVCGNSDTFELLGGTPIGGEYSGQGVDLNGWFDPQITGSGIFEITYEYTDSNGCTNSASSTIEVYSKPEASISGSSSICQNGSPLYVTFSATNGTAPYTFSYNINDGPTQTVNTTNDNSEVSIPFSTSQIGTFNINLLSVEDANGCIADVAEAATIEVDEVDINISLITDNVTCFGFNDGRVTIAATGGTGQFEYSIDGTNFVASPVFDNLSPGDYTLTVRDEFLCATTASTTIEQPDLMEIVNIQVDDVYCRDISAGGSILIEVMGGIDPYYFIWNDQNNSTLNNVTNFADSIIQGTYSVLIIDSNGCTLEELFTIGFLDEDCIVRIPQGFSPNGDGVNDVWETRNLLYLHPDNKIKIFNRQGTLVFEAERYNEDWDGTPNRGNVVIGKEGKVPAGVYFYLIWLELEEKPITGYVYVSY